jgi:hypothetical protein
MVIISSLFQKPPVEMIDVVHNNNNNNNQDRNEGDIIQEIRELLVELESMRLGPIGGATVPQHPTDLEGLRVKILSKDYYGWKGTILRPRGKQFWYIRLDSGRTTHRKHTTFEILRPDNWQFSAAYN